MCLWFFIKVVINLKPFRIDLQTSLFLSLKIANLVSCQHMCNPIYSSVILFVFFNFLEYREIKLLLIDVEKSNILSPQYISFSKTNWSFFELTWKLSFYLYNKNLQQYFLETLYRFPLLKFTGISIDCWNVIKSFLEN